MNENRINDVFNRYGKQVLLDQLHDLGIVEGTSLYNHTLGNTHNAVNAFLRKCDSDDDKSIRSYIASHFPAVQAGDSEEMLKRHVATIHSIHAGNPDLLHYRDAYADSVKARMQKSAEETTNPALKKRFTELADELADEAKLHFNARLASGELAQGESFYNVIRPNDMPEWAVMDEMLRRVTVAHCLSAIRDGLPSHAAAVGGSKDQEIQR